METEVVWSKKLVTDEVTKPGSCAACFSPDGEQLVVASGQDLVIVQAASGVLQQRLSKHQSQILCVGYAANGSSFASGGEDGRVIVWAPQGQAILQFSLRGSVVALNYSPSAQLLAAASGTELALWDSSTNAVTKFPVDGRITSAAWSVEGSSLALGLDDGCISMRSASGAALSLLQADPCAPVACISYSPARSGPTVDVLAVCTGCGTLALFTPDGEAMGQRLHLGYAPHCIAHFVKGGYICISGSNQQAQLYSREGFFLGCAAQMEFHITAIVPHPQRDDTLAVVCRDGTMTLLQIQESLTDVVVQHLGSGERVRMRCRDSVLEIAVQDQRVAVLHPNRVSVYQVTFQLTKLHILQLPEGGTPSEENTDMRYSLVASILQPLESSHMVLLTTHFAICQGDELHWYNFEGDVVQLCKLPGVICFARAHSEPSGLESLLLNLSNGAIMRVVPGLPEAELLISHDSSVRCLDMSRDGTCIALVDSSRTMCVFDCASGELQRCVDDVESLAWHRQIDGLLCWSGAGVLRWCLGSFMAQHIIMTGEVLGFRGCTVYSKCDELASALDVCLSLALL